LQQGIEYPHTNSDPLEQSNTYTAERLVEEYAATKIIPIDGRDLLPATTSVQASNPMNTSSGNRYDDPVFDYIPLAAKTILAAQPDSTLAFGVYVIQM
jgi:hypothetical protein